MTDKPVWPTAWPKCPSCGEMLRFSSTEGTSCSNIECDLYGIWAHDRIWRFIKKTKKQATVLQKKLDKAMAVLQNIADGPVLMDVDIFARQMIKEIEDIKR